MTPVPAAPSAPGEGSGRPGDEPHRFDPYNILDRTDLLPLERTAAHSFPNNPGIKQILLDTYKRGADHGIGHATILSLVYRCEKAEADLLSLRLIDPPAAPPSTPVEGPQPTQADVLAWVAERWPERTTPHWRASKLCEEAGEVMGAIVKMDEGRRTLADLEQETAQVAICAMALAESAGFDLAAAIAAEFARCSRPADPVDGAR